jgi:LPXTG-site transpeptidase (sortase) family protein
MNPVPREQRVALARARLVTAAGIGLLLLSAVIALHDGRIGPASASPSPGRDPSPAVAAATGTAPARVVVPAADIDVPVVDVGTTTSRALEIPPDPRVLGWWRAGAAPGSRHGATVLAGHVDSAEHGRGPFGALAGLSDGDRVRVVDAAGVAHRYRVDSVETYRKEALPYERIFDQSGSPRVVLVTCGGEYDAERGWDSNVVVTVTPRSARTA